MRRSLFLALLAFVALTPSADLVAANPDTTAAEASGAAPADTTARGPLLDSTAAAVEDVLADPDLPRAIWGIYVTDLASGRTILSRNADLTLLPASTMKLLTTATALDALGADYRYTTRLYHLGEASGATLTGDLVIRGAGDPTFGSEWVSADPLQAWAEALFESGVRRIEGRIIGDDDRFEDVAYAEGWDVSHIATESYAPATGGLAWNDNMLDVRFRRGQPSVEPDGLVEFVTDIAAGRSGGGRLQVSRVVGTNQIQLSGTVPSGYNGTIEIPVENPTLYAAAAFAERLAEAGIAVDAEIVDGDALPRPPSYGASEPLRAYVSPPLRDIIERINRASDNLYAEHLFRTLSSSGSTEASARRVKDFLAEAGASTDGLSIVDGSGLSRKDLITPEALGALLAYMHTHEASVAFRRSLPQGGGAGSTLRNRMGGVPVRAKTGSLMAVRGLAGYVDGPRGEPLAFVLMANNYTTRGGRITQAMDRIVRALSTGQRVPADEE
ncbi:MAG: D-alanyl-D-alanine carboxypeptidase/D-alanyl-D-alanine-endopeptidase [Bacteroidota bacterium]